MLSRLFTGFQSRWRRLDRGKGAPGGGLPTRDPWRSPHGHGPMKAERVRMPWRFPIPSPPPPRVVEPRPGKGRVGGPAPKLEGGRDRRPSRLRRAFLARELSGGGGCDRTPSPPPSVPLLLRVRSRSRRLLERGRGRLSSFRSGLFLRDPFVPTSPDVSPPVCPSVFLLFLVF